MQMGRRDKAALGLAGAALVLYAIFQFALFPLWDSVQQERTNLPIQEKKLEKYRQVAVTAGLRSNEASSEEARLREAEGGLLSSTSAALAAAELEQLVKQLTSIEKIDTRSSEFLPSKSLSREYAQVLLGVNFQCRFDQLVSFLNAIGESTKYLTVPKLMIQTIGGKDKQVLVNMQIAGIMRAELPQQGMNGRANVTGRN